MDKRDELLAELKAMRYVRDHQDEINANAIKSLTPNFFPSVKPSQKLGEIPQ